MNAGQTERSLGLRAVALDFIKANLPDVKTSTYTVAETGKEELSGRFEWGTTVEGTKYSGSVNVTRSGDWYNDQKMTVTIELSTNLGGSWATDAQRTIRKYSSRSKPDIVYGTAQAERLAEIKKYIMDCDTRGFEAQKKRCDDKVNHDTIRDLLRSNGFDIAHSTDYMSGTPMRLEVDKFGKAKLSITSEDPVFLAKMRDLVLAEQEK